ncbi:MAG: PrsW family intramembrane metalloprotease [Candidatus Nomurabacteria bacterium]|nr:MAG: PrsW family intramembrane metalloprotease [Candidatus Nomurabacteria bacterium]
MDISSTDFAVAFLFGLIPALFWLWFWLREDNKHPEPYLLIAISFIAGMAVVPLVLPLQKMAIDLYDGSNVMFVWVIIEEVLKYVAALFVILWNKAVDEAIDPIIYMITIALGFAALENTLFILNPLTNGEYSTAAITGSFRFLGSTLLHVLSSATIGVLLALAFYKSASTKLIYGTVGLFIAVLLHALFNFFIMESSGEGILIIFLFVWMGIIMLFLLFEKIKLLESTKKPSSRKRI